MTPPTARSPVASLPVLCSLAAMVTAGLGATAPAAGQEPAELRDVPAPRELPAPVRALCATAPAHTPTGIATALDDAARLLEIRAAATSSRVARRHSEARWPAACAATPPDTSWREARLPWRLSVRPVRLDGSYRTGYPYDLNNGALWAGRGLSTRVQGGVELELPFVSAAVVPAWIYQSNGEFDFPRRTVEGFSEYIYPHYTTHIDFPHRFGDGAFSSVELVQSYVRADAFGAAIGFSNENLWWGPAARYPILMSNTAPGMPHFFFGTSGPTDVWIGRLDAELVWGRVTESDYFDQIPENDQHMVAGVVLAFSPKPLPGLWLGVAQVYHYADDGWGDVGQLLTAAGLDGEPADGNALASLFARWAFPEAGAEVYAEWAREDKSVDFPELMQEPDHSQAYMIGFQRLTPVSDDLGIRVQGELISLQELPELRTGSRPLPVYYMHDEITQGHTHRGQILGAGIGPGGDAQFLAADAIAPWGTAGLWLERVRRAEFSVAAQQLRRNSPYEHDAELTVGLRSLVSTGGLSVAGNLAYTYRYNRDFLDDDVNWSFGFEATWLPRLSWSSRQ